MIFFFHLKEEHSRNGLVPLLFLQQKRGKMANSRTMDIDLAFELIDYINSLLCLFLQIIEIKELNGW